MLKIKLNYHILIISLHISDFSSKSNGSIYYLKACIVIFIESLFRLFLFLLKKKEKKIDKKNVINSSLFPGVS